MVGKVFKSRIFWSFFNLFLFLLGNVIANIILLIGWSITQKSLYALLLPFFVFFIFIEIILMLWLLHWFIHHISMGDIIVNQYNEIVFQNAFQRYTIRLEDVSIATVSYGWRQLNIYTLNPRKKYRLHLENALKFADYINKQVSELQIETL